MSECNKHSSRIQTTIAQPWRKGEREREREREGERERGGGRERERGRGTSPIYTVHVRTRVFCGLTASS